MRRRRMHDEETRKWRNKEQVAVRGSTTHNAVEVSENGPTIRTQVVGNGAKCKRRRLGKLNSGLPKGQLDRMFGDTEGWRATSGAR
jgi:hypothetical protein